MAENENIVSEETPVPEAPVEEKPSFGARFLAGLKERARKFTVNLKRRPMNIAFFVLIISTIVILCSLGTLSQLGLQRDFSLQMQGLCIFIVQLFSILVLVLFMNSFPKRSKKPNWVMLGLTFAFMAVIIGLDVYLYVVWGKNYPVYVSTLDLVNNEEHISAFAKLKPIYDGAMGSVMAHLILVAVSAVLTATYPLYGALINKINTRKEVESTEIKGEIDTSEEV